MPGKPPPEDVLRTLSDGVEFMDKYIELFSNKSTQIKNDIKIFSDDRNVEEFNRINYENCPYSSANNREGLDLCAEQLPANEVLSTVGSADVKVVSCLFVVLPLKSHHFLDSVLYLIC